MEYDTENIEVRSRMYTIHTVSRLAQTHNGHMFSQKPTGFDATLKCYMSKKYGAYSKAQEAPVLHTHSRTTLIAFLEELRRDIKRKNKFAGIFFLSENFLKKKYPVPSGAPL